MNTYLATPSPKDNRKMYSKNYFFFFGSILNRSINKIPKSIYKPVGIMLLRNDILANSLKNTCEISLSLTNNNKISNANATS